MRITPLHFSTIKRRSDFQLLAKSKSRVVSTSIILQTNPTPNDQHLLADFRVGFVVSKAIGNAVIRNRTKRRLRAIVRTILSHCATPHLDYLIVARRHIIDRRYDQLLSDFHYCLKKTQTAHV